MPVPKKSVAERFWEKVDKAGPISTYRPDLGSCWLWMAQINKETGYGCFWVGRDAGKNLNVPAHRVAYGLAMGSIPEGLHIDHLCRVRNCVRPTHLEPVTNAENTRRGDLTSNGDVNRNKTHCIRGHLFDEKNTKWVDGRYGRQRQCRACNAFLARERRAMKGSR